ncbi:AAA family ATPase [Mycolicibacterium rufum]|uniref:AAA family ATPase n=1 Tax=Mycolicibacterium rufum TaxID=318424 RepID=A0ABY3UER9_9MYCO|nr:adenylate/guanylate cyclase domain-containing protein [Mycolicibacterium rufum]ULP38105.1 AAA family ATPase [Mycolicibacterium rufum]
MNEAAGADAPRPVCESCAAPLGATANFCSECGASVRKHSAGSAEYKQVTVLFADVVHSMDIAAAVGAERLREILAELVTMTSSVVDRYGGMLEKFTGDGIMAVFGAPTALEDHASRACMVALHIQQSMRALTDDVRGRDGVDFRLRVGLNSGEVIAGGIGSAAVGYATIGEHVGMAQRMESVAPPGGVMVSASTARLVEDVAQLAGPEMVRIKGASEPVPAYRLTGMRQAGIIKRRRSGLVGRRHEIRTLEAVLDRAVDGHGGLVGVGGPPGIGKSRLVYELSLTAQDRGVRVYSAACESHTSQIPFQTVSRLLRVATGVEGRDAQSAREMLSARFADAELEDQLLLADLLHIADPDIRLPRIDPDARRRRVIALVKAALLARDSSALYILEDVHWIDDVSESLLAEFLSVIRDTPSLVIITYRPEYRGALLAGADALALAPLSDNEIAILVGQLLGSDPSLSPLCRKIVETASGIPYFGEEIVRDLVERGVLRGRAGAYRSSRPVSDVTVPATLMATLGARIDRLDANAKRTLVAAAVVGARFSVDLLQELGVEPRLDDLISAQLVDPISTPSRSEYVFHHPLIRAVAYESQLRADRADMHRRVADALIRRTPATESKDAALIAEHLEAANDVDAAYGWHMRAATWATSRDITAARLSWERARVIADARPPGARDLAAMRIAPRTMLCATAYRSREHGARARFDELRQLCTGAGDKPSLAIAMAGLVMDHAYQGEIRQASHLASEAMALVDSLGNADLTVGLSFPPIYAKIESGDYRDVLRWSQTMIDLADGDPFKGNFIFGSPLALALTSRAIARYCLGLPGWPDDLSQGRAIAQDADPLTYAAVVAWGYFPGIALGALAADDRALSQAADAVRIAERSGNDMALAFARLPLGVALVYGNTSEAHTRGCVLLGEVSDAFSSRRHNLGDRPLVDVLRSREQVRQGNRDSALSMMCSAIDLLDREKQLLSWGIPATGVVVATLLDHAAAGDIDRGKAAIDRLAAAPGGDGLVMRDIWLLRLRALLAGAHGDDATYRHFRDRYRSAAAEYGFEGHVQWGAAMQ